MYRLGFIVVATLAIALGLVVGVLNYQVITVDLMWARISWPLGLMLLTAMMTGFLLGVILSWLFGVLPLQLKMRARSRRGKKTADDTTLTDD